MKTNLVGLNALVIVDNAFISSSTNKETNITKASTSFQFLSKNAKGKKVFMDIKYADVELDNLDSYEGKSVMFEDIKMSSFEGSIYLKTTIKPKIQ